ncbi:hypothetical protein OPT61_g4732 [Boeremia exigua]|uniref:Uncharacterized protein n=1 Tax=Boeremia exigua TaxID=749465 RepID=A0ACC2ICV6_9PLEO|nr:hypothetical protein OPT61_g4732 [Boeremia exigua]
MQKLFYNYRKLETPSSFRLLRIERTPGNVNAPYSYSITLTSLNEAPPYETLSYVWGSNDRSETITLQDGELLPITGPLKEALAFVEQQCTTGYLWVDQICIDQEDRIERGDQVKIMGHIYSSCSRVIVWLGLMANLGSELSLQGDLQHMHPPQALSTETMSSVNRLIHRFRPYPGSRRPSNRSLCHEILQSPWFQRAWVFQEVVLPPSARFVLATTSTTPSQARTISLTDLCATLNHPTVGVDTDGVVADTIRFMYRRSKEGHKTHGYTPSPIEQTLSLLAPRAKTSEELDRLYAFFGLNHDSRILLTPSYESSLAAAMADTATSIIEGTCSLDIFEVIPRTMNSTRHREKLPTWMPDFRKEQLVIPFKRSQSDFRQLAESSPNLRPVFISSTYTYYRGTIYCAGEEKRTIQALGYALDDIDTEIGTLSSRTAHQAHLDALLQRSIKAWKTIKSSAETSLFPRHERRPTQATTSTIDTGFAPIPTEARLQQALVAAGSCATSDETLSNNVPGTTNGSPGSFDTMVQVMRGRTLWMTRSGRFALGSHLRSGDKIYLAYGCSNPFALRGEDVTKVLGTCFLEEWMDPWGSGKMKGVEKGFDPFFIHII